jgi:DNA-binding IclR family transcriptional regulator
MEKKKKKETGTLSTVETAFSILEFIGERGHVSASAIARELSLVRSNVHRLLFTLSRLGYVEKGVSEEYHLTFSLFELGNTVPHSRNLIDSVRPAMLRLAQLTGETVNHGVLYEDEVLYIDKVEATAHLKLDREIGSVDPAYCTSLGKVLLAYQEQEERARILRTLSLVPRTEHSIDDPDRLRRELDEVKRQGYAFDFQELSLELNCVAAPVFDEKGRIVSAMSISGPAVRFTPEKMKSVVEHIKSAAAGI